MKTYLAALLAMVSALGVQAANSSHPNVVLVYADDLGYGDLSCYGSKLVQTPNIDRLAERGLLFTQGYATHSTCTPSRYSLLTGEYAWRRKLGILPGDAPLTIPVSTPTLANLFKNAGYRTGIVGKWHLGLGEPKKGIDWNGKIAPGPNEIGFDESFIIPATVDRVPCVYLENGRVRGLDKADPIQVSYTDPLPGSKYPIGHQQPESKTLQDSDLQHSDTVIKGLGRIGYMAGGEKALWDDADIGDVLVERAKTFITDAGKQPFFLFFSTHDPHDPHVPHARFRGKSQAGLRGDSIVQFDANVGELMKFIEERGMMEDTIFIVTSDNGPIFSDGYEDDDLKFVDKHPASGGLRGGKYSLMEGGTRVPLIVSWPKRIQPGKSDAVVSQVDLFSSFSSILSTPLPSGAAPDSTDKSRVLLGLSKDEPHEIVLCDALGNLALRQGDWKYFAKAQDTRMRKGNGAVKLSESLFNLREDPTESRNLLESYPDLKAMMEERLEKIAKSR
jgi:arylsulfatase A-like enzyme